MAFQLVFATDDEITVWHTDLGHVFHFVIDEPRRDVVVRWMRDVPDAAAPASSVETAAHAFAAEQARVRQLIA